MIPFEVQKSVTSFPVNSFPPSVLRYFTFTSVIFSHLVSISIRACFASDFFLRMTTSEYLLRSSSTDRKYRPPLLVSCSIFPQMSACTSSRGLDVCVSDRGNGRCDCLPRMQHSQRLDLHCLSKVSGILTPFTMHSLTNLYIAVGLGCPNLLCQISQLSGDATLVAMAHTSAVLPSLASIAKYVLLSSPSNALASIKYWLFILTTLHSSSPVGSATEVCSPFGVVPMMKFCAIPDATEKRFCVSPGTYLTSSSQKVVPSGDSMHTVPCPTI